VRASVFEVVKETEKGRERERKCAFI
jgi:hypothetical protein